MKYWHVFYSSLLLVYGRKSYFILTMVVAAAFFALIIWLPNVSLIVQVLSRQGIAWDLKLRLIVGLLKGFATNFTFLKAVLAIVMAFFFGIYLSFVVYLRNASANGLVGTFSGFIGLSCLSCGSFILGSLLPAGTALWLTARLPLAGMEFGLAGILLIIFSLWRLAEGVTGNCIKKYNTKVDSFRVKQYNTMKVLVDKRV